MRVKLYSSASLALLLAAKSSAQVYSPIGAELPVAFMTGSNLFANPLQTDNNALSSLFPSSITPPGTTISLWDPTNSSFDVTATFTSGSWSTNLVLPPGTGVLVFAPSPFTNYISGTVLDHDGSVLLGSGFTLPPPFTGPDGIYLFGDKTPITDTGTNIFLNIVGRLPFPGEKVTSLSGASTYLGSGSWDVIPTLGVGQSVFLTVISEGPPELTITYLNAQAIVSWPPSVSGWTLQTNSDLGTGTWGNYAGQVINNTVTNSPDAENVFFRLVYP